MSDEDLQLDVRALKCPLLFVTVKLWLKKLRKGQQLRVLIDDELGQQDVMSYLQKHGFEFTLTPVKGAPVEMTIIAKDK